MESEYLFHYGKTQSASFSGANIVSTGLIIADPIREEARFELYLGRDR